VLSCLQKSLLHMETFQSNDIPISCNTCCILNAEFSAKCLVKGIKEKDHHIILVYKSQNSEKVKKQNLSLRFDIYCEGCKNIYSPNTRHPRFSHPLPSSQNPVQYPCAVVYLLYEYPFNTCIST